MSTVTENRRRNARALAERIGPTAFGNRIGMNDSQANHIAGPNPVRNIGHNIARRIEAAFHKPTGWLDIDHSRSLDAAIARLSELKPPYRTGREAEVWKEAIAAAIDELRAMQH